MSRKAERQYSIECVTEEVRDFYDQYPYPRPIDNLDTYRRLWQDRQRRRADYHLFWPAKPYSEDFSILIAGCGTSQAAKYAVRWPDARITGIDLSETSIRHTSELKERYKLDNLQVCQLPIDNVRELGKSFDCVVSTGVLHHLADPDAGLNALRGVLKSDGAMHIMVYASYGRTGIYMLQEFCRRLGIRATDEGIGDLIAALKNLPPGHPLEHLLREAPDFRQEAALADALLHPRDRAYSVPQLFDFIKKAGLQFGRWLRQAPYTPHCGIMARIPQYSRLSQLPIAEQYAAVELFRGTMVRHSMVVYGNDTSQGLQPVRFDGDSWFGYIPIRMPDTICIEERLPPGAAAVLINRTHTFRDLFMPIDSLEKRIFDLIDGNLTIGELMERILPGGQQKSRLDLAGTFFERLWWYDQVVFDRSKCQGQHPETGRSDHE